MEENAQGFRALARSMRLRAPIVAALALSIAGAGSRADTGGPPQPRRPAAPVALVPGKVTPVTTMFIATRQPPEREQAAPWSLTASDGSGLLLTRVDAKAVVE